MNSTIAIKTAATQHPVLEVIRQRWSARAFSDAPLAQETLDTLFEAASWAPSAMNEQPWRFVVARREDEAAFSRLAALLKPGNAAWAPHAAALVLVLARQHYSANGAPNINAAHDTGMATQNLLLQAVSMGIYGHVMEGFDKHAAVLQLQLPEELRPLTMIALGYLGEAAQLGEPFQSRELSPRSRKSLEEIVFRVEDLG